MSIFASDNTGYENNNTLGKRLACGICRYNNVHYTYLRHIGPYYHINRNKDRKLKAMMVLSCIESSARSLEASDALFRGDFAIPELSLDSLYTMSRETHLLDSLLN